MHPFCHAGGLLMLFFGWNAANHYPPFPSFHNELAAALGVALLALGLLVKRGVTPANASPPPPPCPALPRAVIVWALCGLLPLLQYAAGMLYFHADALMALLYAWGVAGAIALGALWAARAGRTAVMTSLFGVIVAAALAGFGIACSQWLGLSETLWALRLIGDRPFGNLAQSNHFGLLMVMGIIASVSLYELHAIRHKHVLSVLAGLLGCGVLLSQSRAAALALLCVVGLWLVTRRTTPTRLQVHHVAALSTLWLVLLLGFDDVQSHAYEALGIDTAPSRDRLAGGVRPALWQHFIVATLERPWWGYGFNQGVSAMAEVATQMAPRATLSTEFAHNFVLDLAVWAGWPVAISLTALFAYWSLGWLRPDGSPTLRTERHLVFALWLALAIQSLLEYPYAYAYFLLPAALLAGAITPLRERSTANVWLDRIPFRMALAIGCTASAMLLAVVIDYVRLEDDFRQVRFARANYQNLPEHNYTRQPLVLDSLAARIHSALTPAHADMSQLELAKWRAVARAVQNPAAQVDYAKALILNGRAEDAWHELHILRGLYAPEVYAAIEAEWMDWLAGNSVQQPLFEPDAP
jgi:hypothetical protein